MQVAFARRFFSNVMNETQISPRSSNQIPFGSTDRRDHWWLEPLLNFLGFTAFVLYANWRMVVYLEGGKPNFVWPTASLNMAEGVTMKSVEHDAVYLSPFYSPLLEFGWWWLSPALLIFIFPLGFRLSCYYYRKMYYRSYFLEPAACAVGDRKGAGQHYKGETAFPWIVQNIHRWFLYAAMVVWAILVYDALRAVYPLIPGTGGRALHFGVGNVIMLVNVVLLGGYTFGCHALRHLVGGNIDCWSCTKLGQTRHKLWSVVSRLNLRHMEWAWLSLFSVALTDFYIYWLSTQVTTYQPWY